VLEKELSSDLSRWLRNPAVKLTMGDGWPSRAPLAPIRPTAAEAVA
jgi:hypothetical protein